MKSNLLKHTVQCDGLLALGLAEQFSRKYSYFCLVFNEDRIGEKAQLESPICVGCSSLFFLARRVFNVQT